MSTTKMMTSLIKSTPHLSILVLNLLWMYLTLGLRVSRTRRAFEKQLIKQGMSKQDAQHLSECYKDLKDNITTTIKQSVTTQGLRFTPT